MNKIAIICPYFGKLPLNIELTFKSMSDNIDIDWMIFTDHGEKFVNKYDNVNIINFTFDDLKALIMNKIGTVVYSAYKICDYKPLFGIIFSDYLNNYNFWGYCDLDVIFGKINNFITNDILKKYDKIFDQGHLSIYRNVDGINEIYLQKKEEVKKMLNSSAIMVFDESYEKKHLNINDLLRDGGYSVYVNRNSYADLNRIRKNFHPLCMKKNNSLNYFEYFNGKLFLRNFDLKNKKVEFAYAHYQQKKSIPILCKISNHFYSTPKGFIECGEISKSYFYNKFDYQPILFLKIIIKRKISKIKAKLNKLK